MSNPEPPFAPRPTPSLAWWSGTVQEFRRANFQTIVNQISARAMADFRTNQSTEQPAWGKILSILSESLGNIPSHFRLLIEYPLIRLGHRLDAVLVTDRAIFVIEFKTLTSCFGKAARIQAEDYALDLRDFHAGSRTQIIIPIVIAANGTPARPQWEFPWPGVTQVYEARPDELQTLLCTLLDRIPPGTIDITAWERAPYRPVPNIIEAARSLYQNHGVADIKTARADTYNLEATTEAILDAIRDAEMQSAFIAVFVTGIPGAGKTLCGLNAVFSAAIETCFLTGTLPMVYVLSAALAEDSKTNKEKSVRLADRAAKTKIQSVNRFLNHYRLQPTDLPEHVIVFDEAQRAWDADFGRTKFQLDDSEAAIILDIMRRHQDYAVIVGLIGNGQEINTGEAGLAEWGRALQARPDWQIRASPEVLSANANPRQKLFKTKPPNMTLDDCLHLAEPIRNVITPSAASWVDAVLRGQSTEAQTHANAEAPFFITRDLAQMRAALRARARGKRRAGLVCSSGAKRLVADGIWPNFDHIDQNKVANWFLKSWPDIRASDALEIPATEFACQGLELDYVGLCWGGDLIWQGQWTARKFRGDRWQICRQRDPIDYRINTYRVLLTRARSDTIIWVPRGEVDDETRSPAELDEIVTFLIKCGAKAI